MKRLLWLVFVVAFLFPVSCSADQLFSSFTTYRVALATNTVTLLSSIASSTNLANCKIEWQVNGPKIFWAEGGLSSETVQLSRSMEAGDAYSIGVIGHSFDISFIAAPASLASITLCIFRP